MTLEEAIKHAEEVMTENLEKTKGRNASDPIAINCFECAEDHQQLAEWLKELKQLREQTRWIPVSERLPEIGQDVLIQYGNSMRIAYHKIDSTVYESPFKDLDDTGWYDENDEFIDGTLQVDAWMPLPEPYREDGEMNDE